MTNLMGYICATMGNYKTFFNFLKKLNFFLNLDYFLKLENMKLKSIVIVKNYITVKL